MESKANSLKDDKKISAQQNIKKIFDKFKDL
jgi:hypothetical protein